MEFKHTLKNQYCTGIIMGLEYAMGFINPGIVFKNINTDLTKASYKTKTSLKNFTDICSSFSIGSDKIHTGNFSTGKESVC
jgi:hypothetical protein